MKCANCNKGFSCGCQKTKARDGSTVHKSCLTIYNGKTNVSTNKLTNTINKAKANLLK
tara:strand:- start:194 stop:367 length:174 start_codon:yes stop_codon:yes gene_type:complete